MLILLLYFTLHLTPPSSFHLFITENDGDSSNDNLSDKDTSNKDAATAAADKDSTDANDNPDDLFPMAKTAPKKRGAAAGGRKATPKKSAGRKTTGEEIIDLDTPPRKKPGTLAARYLIEKRGCYTVNPYARGSGIRIGQNKICSKCHF